MRSVGRVMCVREVPLFPSSALLAVIGPARGTPTPHRCPGKKSDDAQKKYRRHGVVAKEGANVNDGSSGGTVRARARRTDYGGDETTEFQSHPHRITRIVPAGRLRSQSEVPPRLFASVPSAFLSLVRFGIFCYFYFVKIVRAFRKTKNVVSPPGMSTDPVVRYDKTSVR